MKSLENIDEEVKRYYYNKNGRNIIINEIASFLYWEFCRKETYTLDGEYTINDLYNDIRKYLNKSYYFGLPRYLKFGWNTKSTDNMDRKVNRILQKHKIPFRIVNEQAKESKSDVIKPTYALQYNGEFPEFGIEKKGLLDVYILDFTYTIFNKASKYYSIIDDDFCKTIDTIYSKLVMSCRLNECITREKVNSLSFWNNEFFSTFSMPFNITVTITNGHKWYKVIRTDKI